MLSNMLDIDDVFTALRRRVAEESSSSEDLASILRHLATLTPAELKRCRDVLNTRFERAHYFDCVQGVRADGLGEPRALTQQMRYQMDTLGACDAFHIACFAGPKATVSLALSSKTLRLISPIDDQGLTAAYIQAFPCPGPIAAGCMGISSQDSITLQPDAFGIVRSGLITHLATGGFAFRSEEGHDEIIPWEWISEINGEAVPDDLPGLDAELLFLMIRPGTSEHIVERMLYFSGWAGKTCLACEVIRRLTPSVHLLGNVLLMAFFNVSIREYVCKDLAHRYSNFLQMLVDKGAVVSEEVAVQACIAHPDDDPDRERHIVFTKRLHHCLILSSTESTADVDSFRAWRLAIDEFKGEFPVLDSWCPLQLSSGDDFLGPDEWLEHSAEAPEEWIFGDDEGFERSFYSPISSSSPPMGQWLPYLDYCYREGTTFTLGHVHATRLVDALGRRKQVVLNVAERVRQTWTSQGWQFRGASREEQMCEVLQHKVLSQVFGLY
eukprot:TRINITY_DN71852_c0_g1_i1.p1 TRINITY_DN71852_c0_g1~~TRINITY_DN71852_c0_g1_i1.p1  ORF type:complete len:496 (+),score=17.54 TRINITY_DN71852_c0_g1_i1:71-1558(+)